MTSRLSKLSLTLFLSLPVLTNFAGAQTAPLSPNAGPIKFDSGTISGLPARNIGSAEMSGRIAALDEGFVIVSSNDPATTLAG